MNAYEGKYSNQFTLDVDNGKAGKLSTSLQKGDGHGFQKAFLHLIDITSKWIGSFR